MNVTQAGCAPVWCLRLQDQVAADRATQLAGHVQAQARALAGRLLGPAFEAVLVAGDPSHRIWARVA